MRQTERQVGARTKFHANALRGNEVVGFQMAVNFMLVMGGTWRSTNERQWVA